ncbi:MAG: type II CAAX endopeptidase family protein [Cyanobacteria bacterium P01_H01_bin.119]
MASRSGHWSAILGLGLLVGAANLGMAARLYVPNPAGTAGFVATRLWILLLPVVWFLRVERRRLTLQKPTQAEGYSGLGLGVAMMGIILGAYWFAGRSLIDAATVQGTAEPLGLLGPIRFGAFAAYFTFVNAFVEEYVWRWFVYRQCARLLSGFAAVGLSAVCFTLHHIIALQGYVGNVWVTVIGSAGVFLAGLVWSICYLKYRSLWAGYISHLLADLAIAIAAAHALFVLD